MPLDGAHALDDLLVPNWILQNTYFEPNTGCYLFVGWNDGKGYGKCRFEGKGWMVHRLVWMLLVGPIPVGHLIDHKCRVHECWRLSHLEPVTVAENTHRGRATLFRPLREYATKLLSKRDEIMQAWTDTNQEPL